MENNLFNLESIKKHVKNFILTPQKRIKLERYIERVQNNEFKGETKGYLAFLKFLEDILDYEEDKNIIFDDNVDIGQDRVEFALKDNDGKFMVIELKGQNADLDKPQNRANDKRKPVEQVFGYAQHSSKKSGLINWILVSNYKEFRLYNYEKRLGEYISFNVDELLNDEKFKYFMFTFSKESHVDLKAINDVINEDYIEKTKLAANFYKLFNETRLMIYKELNELHGMNKEEAISYAQTIVDRFIFICFASSRELLPDEIARKTLLDRIKSENIRDHEIWRELNYLFKDVNKGKKDRDISGYNGGLFTKDFKDIKLKDIIKNKDFFKDVYQKWDFKEFEVRLNKEIKPSILKRLNPIYINLLIISYFDFSEEKKESNGHRLDIDILGHIFENSIGDIEELKADSKGRRKKEGIFYTPDYITDYICKNTIIPYLSLSGESNTVESLLLEYSMGRDVENLDQKVKNIRIVDPACGSGAFLNKATDILLDIHKGIFDIKKGYTTSEPMRIGKGKRRKTENVKFTDLEVYVFDAIEKRREILLDNIYGVDLNSESVEITKLSLFLKVCEKGRKLPELDNNIKCGNSLIDELEFTDKPFKWKEEFKKIFQNGGFDIVIGNPPYITPSIGKKQKTLTENEIKYLNDNFISYEYKGNTFVLFIEHGIEILKNNGILGFITPNTLLTNYYFQKTRNMILNSTKMLVLLNISGKVFQDAETGGNLITIFEKVETPEKENLLKVMQVGKPIEMFSNNFLDINQSLFSQMPDNKFLLDKTEVNLLTKLKNNGIELREIATVYQGIITGDNPRFLSNSKTTKKHKKIVRGRDIGRYSLNFNETYVLFDKDKLWSNTNEEMFLVKEKIISRQTSDHIVATYDNEEYFSLDSTHVIIPHKMNVKYFLGVFNSRLINYYYQKIVPEIGRVFPQIKVVNLKQLPIYLATLKQQDSFVGNVDEMLKINKDFLNEINGFKDWLQQTYYVEKFSKKLDKYYELSFDDFLVELKKKRVDIKTRKTQELLKKEFEESISKINPLLQEIKTTDNEINQMVYELYGLTDEEIKIIEESLNKV